MCVCEAASLSLFFCMQNCIGWCALCITLLFENDFLSPIPTTQLTHQRNEKESTGISAWSEDDGGRECEMKFTSVVMKFNGKMKNESQIGTHTNANNMAYEVGKWTAIAKQPKNVPVIAYKSLSLPRSLNLCDSFRHLCVHLIYDRIIFIHKVFIRIWW